MQRNKSRRPRYRNWQTSAGCARAGTRGAQQGPAARGLGGQPGAPGPMATAEQPPAAPRDRGSALAFLVTGESCGSRGLQLCRATAPTGVEQPGPGATAGRMARCFGHFKHDGGRWWREREQPKGWRCWACHPPDHLAPEQIVEAPDVSPCPTAVQSAVREWPRQLAAACPSRPERGLQWRGPFTSDRLASSRPGQCTSLRGRHPIVGRTP